MIKLKTRLPLYFLRKTILFQIILCMLLLAQVAYAQQAAFIAKTPTKGCRPLTVTFEATAAGNSRWDWKFGNGNTPGGTDASQYKSPSATYTKPGIYTVELMVNGPNGPTEVKTAFIEVYAKPKIDFSFNKASGCAPLPVQFQDKSTAGSGTIASYTWVFGDGDQSGDANPLHTYDYSSPMNVTLQIVNSYGCDSAVTKASAINVMGPRADFNVPTPTFCQVPAHAEFENNSSGDAPLTYKWDFGDGGTSTSAAATVTHDYQTADLYHPTLTVTDKNGCSRTATGDVRTGGEGGLRVTPSKTEVCLGDPIGFTVDSDATIDSYTWSFGNSTGSLDANPTLTYSSPSDAGKTFTVSLRAQLQGKSCASVVSFPIKVSAQPNPDFSYTVDCDYKVTFVNKSQGASRVEWVVNGGPPLAVNTFSQAFPGPGSYPVKLTAYSGLNCAKTITPDRMVIVPAKPVAAFTPNKEQDCIEPSLSGCAPFTVTFTDHSIVDNGVGYNLKWTFSDGTSTASGTTATHTFTTKGDYIVSLEITTTGNPKCTSKTSAKVTVRDVTPVANFSLDKSIACAKEPVSFTDLSSNATFWCWNFGDGGQSNVQNPIHLYDKPGVYDVTLTAKNGGCSSTFTIAHAVTIKDPFVDFKLDKSCGNPYRVSITNLSVNADQLDWDFGDGQTASGNGVTYHDYGAIDDYQITAVGKNNTTQCVVKTQKNVSVYDIDARFSTDVVKPCKGAPVTFKDESQSASLWSWDFDNGKTDGQQNSTTSYDAAGQYTVTLTATDPDGCSDSKTVLIDVLDITGAFSYQGVSDCNNLKVTFTDFSSASPGIEAWDWDFGDGTAHDIYNDTQLPHIPEHVYTAKRSYNVILTLTNGQGTCQFVKTDAVNFTVPTVDFKADKPGNCMNVPISFTNQSYNAQSFKWEFGDSDQHTSTETHPHFAYGQTGKYNVTLKATDQYGCTVPVTKLQFISITKPVADFEATGTYTKCPPLIPVFKDKSVGNVVAWVWDSGDGQQSRIQSPAFTYLKPGEYDVALTATDANGCTDQTIQQKIIYVGGPSGRFSLSTTGPFCLGDSVNFDAETTNAVVHRWDFGDGVVHDQAEMDAGHRYKETGIFHISLVLEDAQSPPCIRVAETLLELPVQDTAVIDFKFPACVFTGEESVFAVDKPQDGLTYTWTVDGESAGNGHELPATLETPGNHNVILNAVNQYGCGSTLVYEVPVQGDVLFVPNVFTPNDDGLNAEFQVLGVDRSTWDLKVFDRWGGPVFEQRDYNNTWRANGLATGVYYYLLKNAICPGREYKGIVSVIR